MTNIAMVTIDCADPPSLAEFWTKVLDAKVVQDFQGEFMILAPPHEGAAVLGLQKVPEPKIGKNRLHFDLHSEDREGDVQRYVGFGATVVDEQKMPGFAWTVLADPEGNVFCVGGETS